MSSSAPLGFGIIGVGMIAGYHAKAIGEVAGAKVIGFAGRDPEKTRAFAAGAGAAFATTSIDELIAHPEVDVICVATPSGAHLEPALAAIRAGKHVVVEKPIEITVARADAIITAAAEARVKLCPIFQARFGDGARQVKAAIEEGRLGKPVLASAYVKWFRGAPYYQGWKGTRLLDGGGALMNQGIHAVDLLQWFAGMAAEVTGYTARRVHLGIEMEDTAVAALKFESGALGTIEATTGAYPGWSRRLEICGDTGSVCLEDDRIVRWDFAQAKPGDDDIRNAKAGTGLGSGAGAANAINHEGHRRQIEDLVEAIHTGREPAIAGSQARNSVAIIRALYESAESGKPVRPAGSLQ